MIRTIALGAIAALAGTFAVATPASARVDFVYQGDDPTPPPGDCWPVSHSRHQWLWACNFPPRGSFVVHKHYGR